MRMRASGRGRTSLSQLIPPGNRRARVYFEEEAAPTKTNAATLPVFAVSHSYSYPKISLYVGRVCHRSAIITLQLEDRIQTC